MKQLHPISVLLVGLLLATSLPAFAQQPEAVDSVVHLDSVKQIGYIRVSQDPRIDRLVDKHRRIGKERDGYDGYRVQIFSGSGPSARTKANTVKAEVLSKFPELKVYIPYDPPNFKVRIGDCRERIQAEALKKEISSVFPSSYIIKDVIKYPKER